MILSHHRPVCFLLQEKMKATFLKKFYFYMLPVDNIAKITRGQVNRQVTCFEMKEQ